MEVREAGRLELLEALWDDAAKPPEKRLQSWVGPQREAMHQDVAPSKQRRLLDHLVDTQADGCIVRGDDGPGADAHHHVDGNLVANEASQDAEVCGSAQAACAQDDADANAIG